MVKMKKVLCVLMVVTGVFAFVGIAGAQTTDATPADNCNKLDCVNQEGNTVKAPNECDISKMGCNNDVPGCPNCRKCALQNVPCPQVIIGNQGSISLTESCPFDYDDYYGYCTSSQGNIEFDQDGFGIPPRNCRFMINICECPAACEIKKDNKVGIQMEILTQGVFWAEDAKAYNTEGERAIWFAAYGPNNSTVTICESLKGKEFPVDPAKDKHHIDNVKYYERLNTRTTPSGRVVYEPINEGTPADGCFAGNIESGNRVQVLQSEAVGDYSLTQLDVDSRLCMWVIDIPAMRLDGTSRSGDIIKVKVRLLWNREKDLLCEHCIAADICECVVEVGIVCCNVKTSSEGCVFFPYVLQGFKEINGWQSGVAISAVGLTALPADAYCTLILQDQKGNTATWTNKALGNSLVWSFPLDDIIANFDKKLEPGATSLTVKSNYPIDGYTFMNANFGFGTGAMARGCGTKCAPNSN